MDTSALFRFSKLLRALNPLMPRVQRHSSPTKKRGTSSSIVVASVYKRLRLPYSISIFSSSYSSDDKTSQRAWFLYKANSNVLIQCFSPPVQCNSVRSLPGQPG
jgi:hypothetical protein